MKNIKALNGMNDQSDLGIPKLIQHPRKLTTGAVVIKREGDHRISDP